MKFTRLNYFVPVPQVRDLAELNTRLQQQCVADRERRLRGRIFSEFRGWVKAKRERAFRVKVMGEA